MIVLVVEDEVLIGIALCMILHVAGHRVWGPAGTVGEAVEMAASEAPDVALVDLNLQGNADGLDLARTLQRRHGTTCIFLTANVSRAHEARDAALGVIAKPYSFDAVLGAVEYAAAARNDEPSKTAPPALQLFR